MIRTWRKNSFVVVLKLYEGQKFKFDFTNCKILWSNIAFKFFIKAPSTLPNISKFLFFFTSTFLDPYQQLLDILKFQDRIITLAAMNSLRMCIIKITSSSISPSLYSYGLLCLSVRPNSLSSVNYYIPVIKIIVNTPSRSKPYNTNENLLSLF